MSVGLISSEHFQGLEHYNPQDELPHAIPGQDPKPLSIMQSWKSTDGHRTTEAKAPTICGIQRPTFWLSIALAIVCVIAIVGLGTVGSLAAKSRSNSEAR